MSYREDPLQRIVGVSWLPAAPQSFVQSSASDPIADENEFADAAAYLPTILDPGDPYPRAKWRTVLFSAGWDEPPHPSPPTYAEVVAGVLVGVTSGTTFSLAGFTDYGGPYDPAFATNYWYSAGAGIVADVFWIPNLGDRWFNTRIHYLDVSVSPGWLHLLNNNEKVRLE